MSPTRTRFKHSPSDTLIYVEPEIVPIWDAYVLLQERCYIFIMNYERLNTLDKLKRQPFKDTEWMSEKWLNSNDPNRRKGKKSSKSSKKHKRFNKKYKSRGKTPRQHRRHYT